MAGYAYYDGEFGKRESIKIPLSDRAIFFGDGVYDAAVGVGDKIFLLKEHIDRFFDNLKRLSIAPPFTKDRFAELLFETVNKSGIDEYFLYFQLSRGSSKRIHSYVDANEAHILITVDGFSVPEPKKNLKLITAEDLRYYYCDVKTVNLLPAVLASGAAQKNGCDEAVFHRGPVVTECAHSNISILKNRVLYTHPKNRLILSGISRARLIFHAKRLGIECIERPFTLSELFSADEVIVTSTSRLCAAAESVNGISVGGDDSETIDVLFSEIYREFSDFCMPKK